MIENVNIKQLLEIINLLNRKSTDNKITKDGEIRIVILQRGWVMIGRFYQDGHDCCIENGYVIRCWGTEYGLGQLAIEGIQQNTKLDKIPTTKFHELTIVASIICDKNKWSNLC